MATIQWRPEINALTTPPSWRPRFLPRNVAGTADMAERMAAALPNYSAEEFRTFIDLHNQLISESLSNGEQVTEENAVTYSLSFTGRLDSPDDPLPDINDCLQVRIHASPPFIDNIRQAAKTERLPMHKKTPLISTARDTVLDLSDVLNPQGLLRLTGELLFFDRQQGTGECVIAGTESGSTVQTRFGKVEDSEIILMPDIPAQANLWNNEYTVSVSTRYSEHGTLRTGTCGRMLRTPLTVPGLGLPTVPETGILTGSSPTAHVGINGGSVSADTMLRIQVIQDLADNRLRFSLLDMTEGGLVADEVTVTQDGEYILPGFAGSAVSTLEITVNDYAALWDMIRNDYSGRLVDVLDVTLT
jgi:hypothetical protein